MRVPACVTAGLLVCAALGCGAKKSCLRAAPEVAGKPHKHLRFIFISPMREEFFDPVKKGMEDAARMMGVEATFTGPEHLDVKAQAAMVTRAVADGYDGIAVDIVDPVAFDDAVRSAVEKGVPVVAFNVDDNATPNARLGSVCQNLYQAGRTLGARALDFVPPNGKVLMTMHDEGVSALEDRLRGAQEELGKKGVTWKVVVTTKEQARAREIITRALKDDPGIKTVLCTGQADTEAAGVVLEKAFAGKGYVAAGFDLSPDILRLIKAGFIRFTIDQQPYIQGFYSVIQLALYCRYGIRPSNIDAGAALITGAEVDSVVELKKKNYR